MGKYRYAADALTKWGPYDPEQECRDIDLDEYESFYGQTPDEAIKKAEAESLTGEAYLVRLEYFRPQYGDWDIDWDESNRIEHYA